MDLDQLQSVRDRERQTDRLQQLRDSFYEEAAAFVRDLRAERDEAAAAADDPFDAPRVNRLTDRIRTAEQTLEAIYEKRVGKVVKAATFAAADLPAEAEGMTREEDELFETLVAEIEQNRETVLGRLDEDSGTDGDVFGDDAGETAAGDQPGPEAGETAGTAPDDAGDEEDGLDAAAVMGENPDAGDAAPPADHPPPDGPGPGESAAGEDAGSVAEHDGERSTDPDDADGDQPDGEHDTAPDGESGARTVDSTGDGSTDVDRELLRITDDVGPILGVDEREYDLAEDDVVTLPAENARPLVERGAAERLE